MCRRRVRSHAVSHGRRTDYVPCGYCSIWCAFGRPLRPLRCGLKSRTGAVWATVTSAALSAAACGLLVVGTHYFSVILFVNCPASKGDSHARSTREVGRYPRSCTHIRRSDSHHRDARRHKSARRHLRRLVAVPDGPCRFDRCYPARQWPRCDGRHHSHDLRYWLATRSHATATWSGSEIRRSP